MLLVSNGAVKVFSWDQATFSNLTFTGGTMAEQYAWKWRGSPSEHTIWNRYPSISAAIAALPTLSGWGWKHVNPYLVRILPGTKQRALFRKVDVESGRGKFIGWVLKSDEQGLPWFYLNNSHANWTIALDKAWLARDANELSTLVWAAQANTQMTFGIWRVMEIGSEETYEEVK